MKQQWQKLLYIQQPYPDNYVDKSFLEEMKKNGRRVNIANVRPIYYWTAVVQSCRVSQQYSVVFLFIRIFLYLMQGDIPPVWLAMFSVVFISLYVLWTRIARAECLFD